MYQSYGIGYQEYNTKLEKRIQIEQKRERDHQRSIQIVAEHQRQLHT